MPHDHAILVLEDGRTFTGRAWGARGATFGEIVFNTAMTGYQETLTDPSYHKQIVVATFPHIGNTGVNSEDDESAQIWVSGYVARDPVPRPSNWRSEGSLDDWLERQGVVGIRHVDTRAITRHLRERGVMRAGIFSGDALLSDGHPRRTDELIDDVNRQPLMAGADLAGEVSTHTSYTLEPAATDVPGYGLTVAAIDLGIKAMTPQRMAERGLRVHVLPAGTTFDEITALGVDGVFFSNGPGDPGAATHPVDLARQVLDAGIPFFGICFGHQILGRALGFGTSKLTYGHRGVNQPVLDRARGTVAVTAHNHGFAVDAPIDGDSVAPYDDGRYGRVRVSHLALNDDVVEGIAALDLPAFSVQYHPEAAAGPHDADTLFDDFVALMRKDGRAETN